MAETQTGYRERARERERKKETKREKERAREREKRKRVREKQTERGAAASTRSMLQRWMPQLRSEYHLDRHGAPPSQVTWISGVPGLSI
jgi:hypothetical protein